MKYLSIGFVCLVSLAGQAQSLEVAPGHQFTAVDLQWLKPFNQNLPELLFYTRSRYQVDYEDQTSYFISLITAYQLLAKDKIGLATEIIADDFGMTYKGGLQYLDAHERKLWYTWINVGYSDQMLYGWFILIRYLPKLSEHWSLYFQLELVNNFKREGNLFAAQRPRFGLDYRGIQFGAACDLSQVGTEWSNLSNYGFFLRKDF